MKKCVFVCHRAGEGVSGLGADQDRDSGPQTDPAEQLGEDGFGRGLRPEGVRQEAGTKHAAPVGLLRLSAERRQPTQRRAGAADGGGGDGVPGVACPGPGGPLHPGPEGAAEAAQPEHHLPAGQQSR